MELSNLTKEETEIVRKCMQCIADGKVILHDFEFQAIMGVDVDDFLEVFRAWPDIDENDGRVKMSINNSLANLLGYPHGMQNRWSEVMSTPIKEIARVFQKWRGISINSYFEGIE